jgi:excinuclease UvrABC helicase subunit UvrB
MFNLFGDLNKKSLDEILNEFRLEVGLKPIDFFKEDKTSVKHGSDKDGEWTSETYKSEDGSLTITSFTKTFNGNLNSDVKSDTLSKLQEKLDNSIKNQDFEESVILRDKINSLKKNSEEISNLEKELEVSISKQDFENCIKLRNKLNKLKNLK